MLGTDHLCKRFQFLVRRRIIRILQVPCHGLDRTNQLFGKKVRDTDTNQQYSHKYQRNDRRCRNENRPQTFRIHGHTKNSAIIQQHCIVESIFIHGIGFSYCFSHTFGKGLLNFRSVNMVGKSFCTCIIIIQYRSIRTHPGNTKFCDICGQINAIYVHIHNLKVMGIPKQLGTYRKVSAHLFFKQTVIYKCNTEHSGYNR